MCKVTCRHCGHPFVVEGIVSSREHDCFCSVRCLRESLMENDCVGNRDLSFQVTTLVKLAPLTIGTQPESSQLHLVGILGH